MSTEQRADMINNALKRRMQNSMDDILGGINMRNFFITGRTLRNYMKRMGYRYNRVS